MKTPYLQPDGTYLIPWADLRAASAWEKLTGTAASAPTAEAAMRQISDQAERAREFFFPPSTPAADPQPPSR